MECIFIHDFRSYKKNGEVYTTNISYEILKKRYIDVFGKLYILNRSGVLSSSSNEKDLVKASGKNVIFIDEIGIFNPFSFIFNFLKIRKIVQKNVEKSEYVIIRLDSFLGLIAAGYSRKKNKRYLIEVVGCVWDSFWNKGIWGKIIAMPLLKKMQYEIKQAPYVVYVTKKFLQNRYPTNGKNTSISNVQLSKLDSNILRKRIDRIKNYHERKIYKIVTIASVDVRYKGQEAVIKALFELKKKGKTNFQYHLIGGGKGDFLRRLVCKLNINEQVFFHGSMNHNKVMDFLNKCDIYIQPSKQEGLPRSLIEGMSRGLLCYGTNIAGIPELLEEKMLFSSKRKGYIELAQKLEKINKNIFLEQAELNFKKAKNYEEDYLEKNRREFFRAFKK